MPLMHGAGSTYDCLVMWCLGLIGNAGKRRACLGTEEAMMEATPETLANVIASEMSNSRHVVQLPDGRRHVVIDLNISYVQEALSYPYDEGLVDRVLREYGEWFTANQWKLVYVRRTNRAVPGLIQQDLLLLIGTRPALPGMASAY
jgi:hypothetical protein